MEYYHDETKKLRDIIKDIDIDPKLKNTHGRKTKV